MKNSPETSETIEVHLGFGINFPSARGKVQLKGSWFGFELSCRYRFV